MMLEERSDGRIARSLLQRATRMQQIQITTLTDGGQRPADVARGIAGFLARARETLDLALYDVRFETDAGGLVLASLLAAVQRGVAVRLLYNVAHPGPIPVPPPPETAPEALEALPVETRAVPGVPDLMHHKIVVCDGDAVWTGSTNWTDDSWSRQENVIVTVGSQPIAYAYSLAFDELWESGRVEGSGRVEPRPEDVDGARVRPWFCPENGEALSHRVAKAIGKARERVRIASPVLTSGPILATLVETINEGRCPVAGVIDDTQVDEVFFQWRTNGVSEWKIPLLRRILEGASFSGKVTTRWSPTSVHDFMHAKVVVADDTSFVGSFNFSRSGERNAENVLEIRDRSIAERLAAYVDELRARYPRATPPEDGARPLPHLDAERASP
jgi:phosphatidylserine/phosphatidylglycerophosphate/cardiolipin synthase-like enzyme